MQMEKFKGN